MRPPAGYAARPVTDRDLDDVVALVHAAQLASRGATEDVREFLEWFWHNPRVDPARDTVLVTAGEDLAAYGDVMWDPASPAPLGGGGVVHPLHRGRGIGTAIVRWTLDAAQARGAPGVRHWGVYVGDLAARALFEAIGFWHVRNSYTMARALALEFATGG